MKKQIHGRRYKTINSCIAAFFKCRRKDIDKIKGNWEWQDANGKKHRQSNKSAIKDIRKRDVWGFVHDKKEIHYFIRKKAPLREVIGLFAHELAHMERPFHRTTKEEQKACKYSEIAEAAYDLAMQARGV